MKGRSPGANKFSFGLGSCKLLMIVYIGPR